MDGGDSCPTMQRHLMPLHCILKNAQSVSFVICVFYQNLKKMSVLQWWVTVFWLKTDRGKDHFGVGLGNTCLIHSTAVVQMPSRHPILWWELDCPFGGQASTTATIMKGDQCLWVIRRRSTLKMIKTNLPTTHWQLFLPCVSSTMNQT